MIEVAIRPQISYFDTCKEFAEAFELNENDLVLTNDYIYNPYFGELGAKTHQIFQEKYGKGEPTDVMVDEILKDAAKTNCKRIIAIGGGTVIDIAKIMAVSAGEPLDDLYADPAAITKKRELIIIPTTCGTGSEVTNISIINRTRLGTKMGLVSPYMFADHAVLIPELLEKLPFAVFATSSIDALVHAVESSLSPKASDITKMFGYKAIEMIIKGYKDIEKNGPEARIPYMREFLLASTYAGVAFGNAGCAAVHATSYPLGGTYHVPHGESNYAMFTGVLKNYMEIKSDGEIKILNEFIANLLECDVAVVYDKLDELLGKLIPKKPLHEYGVTEEDLPVFTKAVMETQGRLMGNNFVPLDADRVLKIYKELY